MKLKNIIKRTALAALLLSAGGCSDDNIFLPDGTWTGEIPDEWTMTLVIPDPQIVNVGGTRAYDGTLGVRQVNVVLYDGDNNVISNTELDKWTVNDDQTVTVTVPLDGNAHDVAIVLNAKDTYDSNDNEESYDSTNKKDPSEVFVKSLYVDDDGVTYPVLWGKSDLRTVMENKTMPLLRNTSMVTVKMDKGKVDNFDISLVGVFGTSEKGSLGAGAVNSDGLPEAVTEPSGGTMTYLPTSENASANMKTWEGRQTGNVVSMSLSGFYETLAHYGEGSFTLNGQTYEGKDIPRVIIKGRYTDPTDKTSIEGFYVVALTKRKTENDKTHSETEGHFSYEELLPMLRNHEYIINITEVRADGWAKLEDAMKALPDNRLTVTVEDSSPNITDIEATRDYYLGVGADVVAAYNAPAIIEVATSYPGLSTNDNWDNRLDFESDEDWIKVDEIKLATDGEKQGVGNAKIYTLEVPLKENNESTDRYGKIRVRAGKLSREIYVTQEGQPYTRMRPIKLTGLSQGSKAHDIANFYGWMEGKVYDGNGIATGVATDSVQGMSRQANRNAQRRNGLHFPAVPLYTATYEMDIQTGETAEITEGKSTFKCATSGGKLTITLADEAPEIGITTGRLKISNFGGTDKTVEFPLYRTGVFHYLSPDAAKYQPDGVVHPSGWFYYEVVKIGDTYTLDRNLGAASNRFYTNGSSQYRSDVYKKAVGGYFKVNHHRWEKYNETDEIVNMRQDQETITAQLGLSSTKGKFIIATEDDVLSWNIQPGSTVSATISSGRVNDNTIYFPNAGYYEGDELKNDLHTIFWTRTYLGGTQGLGKTSDEYGYWYRYYDDMKSTKPENRFSNISMARGAGVNKKAPNELSVWRYMPLRLVWVKPDCTNPEGDTTVDHTVTGKMVIYFEDVLGWNSASYYVWNLTAETPAWGNRESMEKVAGTANLYRTEIAAPKDNAGIIFTATGKEDNGNATKEYSGLKKDYDDGNTVLYFKASLSSSGRCDYTVAKGSEDNYGGGSTPTPTERDRVTIILRNTQEWKNVQVILNNGGSTTPFNMDEITLTADNQKANIANITLSQYQNLNIDNLEIYFNFKDKNGVYHKGGTSLDQISSNKDNTVFIYENKSSSYHPDSKYSGTVVPEYRNGWSDSSFPNIDLYLRGANFGNWVADNKYKFSQNGNIFTLKLDSDLTGTWKIGSGESSNWTYSYGANGSLTVGTSMGVSKGKGGDFDTTIVGPVTITLTFTGTSADNGNILISTSAPQPSWTPTSPPDLYIIGKMNGWSLSDSNYKMTRYRNVYRYQAKNGIYSGTSGSDAGWKINNGSWGDYVLGVINNIQPTRGVEYQTKHDTGSSNISEINVPVNIYVILEKNNNNEVDTDNIKLLIIDSEN